MFYANVTKVKSVFFDIVNWIFVNDAIVNR